MRIILLTQGSAILFICWSLRDLVNWKFLYHVQVYISGWSHHVRRRDQ